MSWPAGKSSISALAVKSLSGRASTKAVWRISLKLSVVATSITMRADRPARMVIEVATTDSFKDIRHTAFVDALPESDFTAKALIEDLPAGQDIFYRLR